MSLRVVFDTNTIISALVFRTGRLEWLRAHWKQGTCTPLASQATLAELVRVLTYPKFSLRPEDRNELLAEYLPWCGIVSVPGKSPLACRDPKDQIFIDLARAGKADLLVTGDRDLLALPGRATFAVQTPEIYRHQLASG